MLLIGRLVYEKGFQVALEAMPELIERVPGTRFLVAGSGTHEEELKRQAAELGLMEHGTFLGWIGDDVLHSLYRIADVCVVPSIYEPFGLVALEAMASGCPCIVADTGGLREVVPARGRRAALPGPRPRGLADVAVTRPARRGPRPPAGRRGPRPRPRFDWADVAASTAELYRRARRGPPARLSSAPARLLSLVHRVIGARQH